MEKIVGRKDMCRRLRRWEKLLRKPLEDAGGGKPTANTLLKLDVTLGKPYKSPPPHPLSYRVPLTPFFNVQGSNYYSSILLNKSEGLKKPERI